jgi:hypothetical protein
MTNGEDTMGGPQLDVILYELNEVPWTVVDYYIERRPDSNLAALVHRGQSLTTHHDDSVHLSPWRTWPTVHTSTYDHNSFDLGQDPATFRGDPIWDVAERAGLSVGIFGPLQSWPARQFSHGDFYIPDTFSQDSKTYPASLQRFQQFNLAMTIENGFSSDAPLNAKTLLATSVDLVRHGLTLRSAFTLAVHLIRERRDGRYKARRPALQVVPGFDLYWRLHRKHQPRLSIFYTNHVAAMMHRYWGDAMPCYTDSHHYVADDVYGSFIMTAMDYADKQLGRIRKYLAANPQSMLVVAASMGQGPVESRFTDRGLFVLEDHAQLVSRLGLKPAELGLAMYPCLSLVFANGAAAQESVAPLESVIAEGGHPLFYDGSCRLEGKTVTLEIDNAYHTADAEPRMSTQLHFRPLGAESDVTGTPADLGLTIRARIGGDNTAYHIPEGMMLAYGAGVSPDPSRKEVDVLDVAPSLLANVLGVAPAPSMRGVPSLFA